ncbi:MAG: fibronectin type III domain-containing protein, partial [Candidatus Moraniibacteriota bacterium]
CIVLLAWVTVNFILTLPIFNTSTNLIRTGWDTVQCQTSSLSAGATTPMAAGGGGGSAGGGAGGTGDDVVTVPRGDTGTPGTFLLPAPTGLVANAPSTSTATISWTPASGSSAGTVYQLERCTGLTCTIFTPIATVTGTSYTNTGLAAGTGYSYRVRAVTASGELSNWSTVTGTTTVADPISNPGTPPDNPGTPGTPPSGTCIGPGTPQYLLGKTWVSNRINPDGTPIRTEVSFVGSAANNNLGMNLTITCQMSALGHGNDLSPSVTALIQNATASTFDIVPNYEQTLINNRGYTCTVRTVTETATYTPLSDTTMRLFGLDFTGTCN